MCELNPSMRGGMLAEPRTPTQTLIIAALLRRAADAADADADADADAAAGGASHKAKLEERRRREQTGVWVALADEQKKTEWAWRGSGDALAPREARWAAGEPDFDWPAEGWCLELLADGTWNDLDCAQERRYACEVPVARV